MPASSFLSKNANFDISDFRDLEERERSTKVQAKLSEVIDEIMKATWDI